MTDPARILEDRVEDLAREIIKTVNEAEVAERPNIRAELKDFAISLLQDSIAPVEPVSAVAEESAGATFNPLAMGIPLLLVGAVLFFLFPPVGMMLFAVAVLMVVWGLFASLVRR
jgi:hypothetical protein